MRREMEDNPSRGRGGKFPWPESGKTTIKNVEISKNGRGGGVRLARRKKRERSGVSKRRKNPKGGEKGGLRGKSEKRVNDEKRGDTRRTKLVVGEEERGTPRRPKVNLMRRVQVGGKKGVEDREKTGREKIKGKKK